MDKTSFELHLAALLEKAANLIPPQPLPPLSGLHNFPDVPDWHSHELELWNIGEQIRQLTTAEKRSFCDGQVNQILQICQNPNAGRGRQSFVLLLGRTRYAGYAEEVASLLPDQDINGQVINTLYKMKAPGYSDRICPFLSDPQTWIRNEAKRYLQKYN